MPSLISFGTVVNPQRQQAKSFVTNRVGDWFMVATFAIWSALGTVTYTEIASSP